MQRDAITDPGARVPVVLGDTGDIAAGDIALTPPPEVEGHVAGCLCCRSRSPLGRELGRLFSARARGEVAFFHRVVVLAGSATAPELMRQIAADPVAAARFRYEPAC